MKRYSLGTIVLLVAACGGSHTAIERNRAGAGSATLLVTADVTATASGTSPATSFSVNLRDGLNNRVSGATVIVHNDKIGDVTLAETATGSGRYTGSSPSVPEGDYSLAVARGTDSVSGVVVGNPGPHAVNAPAPNATVKANADLPLSWTTPTVAKSVSIQTQQFAVQAPDTGSYTIPAANNPATANQRLDVSRLNEVEIAGGLPGSRLRVTYTTSVDPYTVQ